MSPVTCSFSFDLTARKIDATIVKINFNCHFEKKIKPIMGKKLFGNTLIKFISFKLYNKSLHILKL